MEFLCDFSVNINPRERTLVVPSVAGSHLTISTDANRRKLPSTFQEAGQKLTVPPAVCEVTASTMSKLVRKRGNQAFLGVIKEGQIFELKELSSQTGSGSKAISPG